MTDSAFARTTVYAVRDIPTGQRISYRYRLRRDAVECLQYIARRAGNVSNLEIYRTSQELPKAGKPRP